MSESKYETLAKLGIKQSKAFYAAQEEAATGAFKITKRFIQYLDCPAENVTHAVVDPHTFEIDIDTEGGLPFRNAIPKVVYDDQNGFWYFGFAIHLKLKDHPHHWNTQGLRLGIRLEKGKYVIQSDKETIIGQSLPEKELTSFFDELYNGFLIDFQRDLANPFQHAKRIGFRPTSPGTSEPGS